MSEATPTPENWHGTVSEGKHRASPEEVARFNDAFWQWLKDNETDDFGGDLSRFATAYHGRPHALSSGTYRGLHIRASEHQDLIQDHLSEWVLPGAGSVIEDAAADRRTPSLLPAPAEELQGGRQEDQVGRSYGFELATEEARTITQALDNAGSKRSPATT